MAEKRKDSKGRILKDNESVMPDGRYRYQYVDSFGKRKAIYSWKLVPTDKIPDGKRPDLSLREKIKQVQKDVLSAIKEKTLEKDGQISEDIISKLKWKYKYLASSEIPTKTSVSKLKQMEGGLDIDDLIDEAKKKMKLYNNTEAQSANEEHVDAKEENLNTARTLNGKPKFLERFKKSL